MKHSVSRASTYRMKRIDEKLRAKKYPNCRTLADEFEVSEKSVQRDLEHMRVLLGAPIAYDRSKRGFYYTEPNYFLPSVYLKHGEAKAFGVLQRILKQYEETPYYKELESAMHRVFENLPGKSDPFSEEEIYSFEQPPPPSRPLDREHFQQIDRAANRREVIDITYYAASRNETSRRGVHPYHLHFAQGTWYLIAHCELRRELRFFALNRISEIRETSRPFAIPEDFSLNNYLAKTFDMTHDETLYDIELRFSPYQARWMRERKWHLSQTTETQEDGSLVMRLEISGLDALKRWLLKYGAEVEVLKPPELRASVAEEIKRMQKLYGVE
ncbi:conserved hypothetical protein [Chloroherpeton thalassium ATCC 35110]|uniref:Uncharacterized protein n=1 Tax=Chloroherpeton thalassium (strain ATCC 35110 / GB-78) TaxID=517418 RepID=B3QT91_CHLT3|nr:WYL domain-containing protein [Chloroherpeton thalassium]ACF14190.1 conserved hypothetical protein [Chloroherpeton thalassium ATCC 35110]